MADSILDTVNAAYEDLSTPDAPPPAAEAPEVAAETPAAPETDEQKAERARDEAGRFAKQPKEAKPRETLKLKEKPQATAPPADGIVAASATPAPAAPIPEKIPAPQEWGGLAKVKWDKLPVAVQQEIVQHEQTRMAATADIVPVKELLDTNREFLVNQAGSTTEALRQMMQFAHMASTVDGSIQLAQHILRSKGIDPRQVFAGQQVAPQQAQAPGPQSLEQEVQQLRAEFQRQQQLLNQQEIQQLQSTINSFASDPKRPFFNDVRQQMGQLIDARLASSLEEAYEKACKLNPTVSAHFEQAQREAMETARAAQVQKARAATRATVTGSPLNGAMPAGGGPKGNIRDVVRELYDDMETR